MKKEPINLLGLVRHTCLALTLSGTAFVQHGLGAVASTNLATRSEILATATLVNDHWIANNGLDDAAWSSATYYTGNQRFYEITGEPAYLNRAVSWATANGWLRSEKSRFNGDVVRNDEDADNHCCGQTYIDLYRIDPQPIRIADIIRVEDYIVSQPDTDFWSWIDAFYMQAPTLAKLSALTTNSAYSDKLWAMYQDTKVDQNLFDATAGLWFRDKKYIYPAETTSGGNKVFWARGNGWMIAGLCRVIAALPADAPHRDAYIAMVQTMAAALIPLQQPDGFWRSSLHEPTQFDMPETSGTSFYTYAMAWGMNNGILDKETYLPVVAKAWNGLIAESVHPDGFLGYVQLVAAAPGASYYEDTKAYGVGAFLLAASELSFLATDPISIPRAGADQDVVDIDADGVARVRLDGSGSTTADDRELSHEWWMNGAPLATGAVVIVELPVGNHAVELRVNDGIDPASADTTSITIHPAGHISASATESQDPNLPANVLDGDLETRWSASGDPQAITFDLGSLRVVEQVSMAFFSGDARTSNFDVSVSADAVAWTPVLSDVDSSGSTLELEAFDFPDALGRYVRITGHGNSSSAWNSYTEVVVQSTPSDADGDGDQIPDNWELARIGTSSGDENDNSDGDDMTALHEYIVGRDAGIADAEPPLSILTTSNLTEITFSVPVAEGVGYAELVRYAELSQTDNLLSNQWSTVSGTERSAGRSEPHVFPTPTDSTNSTRAFRAVYWLE